MKGRQASKVREESLPSDICNYEENTTLGAQVVNMLQISNGKGFELRSPWSCKSNNLNSERKRYITLKWASSITQLRARLAAKTIFSLDRVLSQAGSDSLTDIIDANEWHHILMQWSLESVFQQEEKESEFSNHFPSTNLIEHKNSCIMQLQTWLR